MTLSQAVEFLGATSITSFRRSAKEKNCLLRDGRIVFVDVRKYVQSIVANSLVNEPKSGKTKRTSKGSRRGILMARLARAPELIERKKEAIKEAQLAVKNETVPYLKQRSSARLAELEAGLKKLEANQADDTKALREIEYGPEE